MSSRTTDSSKFVWTAAIASTVSLGAAVVAALVVSNYKKNKGRCDHGPDDENCLCISARRQKCIYLDYNGTTPIYPEVLEAMMPYFKTHFGNPSSSHAYARQPRWAVNRARTSILHLLGVIPPTEVFDIPEKDLASIIFTGCGSEADNLAIHLALKHYQHTTSTTAGNKKPHIVTSNVEHPAIAACLQALVEQGQLDVTWVPVGPDGRVQASDMIKAIREDKTTVLVTLMLANNEVGSLQPVAEVSKACREKGVLFHTDAAQALGKVSVTLADLGHPDMISLVGHKIGAPKGIAALYVRPGCVTTTSCQTGVMVAGGNQEFGLRAGTENVPYIVGMGKAVDRVREHWKQTAETTEALRSRLLSGLQKKIANEYMIVNGPSDKSLRLPNTLSVGFKHVNGAKVCKDLYEKVGMSTGATCHTAGGSISSTLKAMNVEEIFARGTLRLSIGPTITEQDIDKAVDHIARAAEYYIRENDKTYVSPTGK